MRRIRSKTSRGFEFYSYFVYNQNQHQNLDQVEILIPGMDQGLMELRRSQGQVLTLIPQWPQDTYTAPC